jgi:HAD superfamily hydrolase (TIGR01457 family)
MDKDISVLKNIRLFVLDMDGTFYLGNKVIDGSLRFMEKLRASGKEFLFFTNNSSRTAEFYREKLRSMGCEVAQNNIITSGDVTIAYLKRYYPGKNVYVVGTPILEDSFRQAGIKLVQQNPDIVVMGFDTTLTYEKLSKACKYIREGALFLATHMDINCPTEQGSIPDCGAMCALITSSTGVSPRYLGKPFAETLEAIIGATGCKKDEIAFVGDRLYTDIAIGVKNGVTGILVLSGETGPEEIEHSEFKPDFVFPSLAYLAEVI